MVQVQASVNGSDVQGLVERNGRVWLDDVPLAEGTNTVVITATNAAGMSSQTNLTLIKSPVIITINPLPANELNQPYVTVSGTVSEEGYRVWVNGVEATVSGDPTWDVDDVPVDADGVATLDVQAGTDADSPVSMQSASQRQSVMVEASDYDAMGYFQWTAPNAYGQSDGTMTEILDWNYQTGGTWNFYAVFTDEGTNWLGGGNGNYSGDKGPDGMEWPTAEFADLDSPTSLRNVQTRLVVMPPGQVKAGGVNLYWVSASASEMSPLIDPSDIDLMANYLDHDQFFDLWGDDWYEGSEPLPASWLTINGQPLTNDVTVADDGTIWGSTLVAGPSGAPVDVTPEATRVHDNWDYTFKAKAQQVKLKLYAITNGVAIDLSSNVPEFCVGQLVTFSNAFDPPLPTNTPVQYQWIFWPDYLNNFLNPVNPDGSYYPDINSNLLTQKVSPIWWYSGGNKMVWCKVTIQLPNGQRTTIIPEGTVSIYRPSISLVDDPPSWATNATVDGIYSLSLGDGNHGDMEYEVDVLSKYGGRADLTQLINRSAANGNTSDSTGGQYWMDNHRFYTARQDGSNGGFNITINQPYPLYFSDGPYFELAHSTFNNTTSIFDQFKNYVIFRPNIGNPADNIYVTLGVVSGGNPSWSWSSSTTYFDGAWSVPTYYIVRPTAPDESDGFPQWLHTYKN